jgi:hypothetical protein
MTAATTERLRREAHQLAEKLTAVTAHHDAESFLVYARHEIEVALNRAAHTVEIDVAVLTAHDVACQLDVIRHRPDFVRHATAFLAALKRGAE